MSRRTNRCLSIFFYCSSRTVSNLEKKKKVSPKITRVRNKIEECKLQENQNFPNFERKFLSFTQRTANSSKRKNE